VAGFEIFRCHQMVRLFGDLDLGKCQGILTLLRVRNIEIFIGILRLSSELLQIDSPRIFICAELIQVRGNDWFGGAMR